MAPPKDFHMLTPFEKLKAVFIPVLAFISISMGLAIFASNVPVSSEKIHGTLIRIGGSANYESAAYAIAYMQLDNGRTVSAPLQYGAIWPKEGDRISVVRYINRFFGDSFGLIQ